MGKSLLSGIWWVLKAGAVLVFGLIILNKLAIDGRDWIVWICAPVAYAFYFYAKDIDQLRRRVEALEEHKNRQEWASIDDD